MRKTGITDLPLHYGTCPPWLFKRMKELSGAIIKVIVLEYGQDEFIRRLSDPFFFQSFGCVLGFDFHSSGLTTTVCGAMKEAIKPEELGIAVVGGKGKSSRKTPTEIEKVADTFNLSEKNIEKLKYSSRMSAKVDNVAVQDGFTLYHHTLVFTEKGKWAVIQQGMDVQSRYARRYHWLSENIKSFVEEPHAAICCDKKQQFVLDMTAAQSGEARKISVDVVNENPNKLLKIFKKQTLINDFLGQKTLEFRMCAKHYIVDAKRVNMKTLQKVHEIKPKNYEEFISIQNVGPKIVRALALISDIIYGKPPSWEDPVKYSYAHGGKDGVPYPVDKKTYDTSISILKNAIEEAELGKTEKIKAIKRLEGFM